ncbi:hypothetical protein RND71_027940 [Anisodus tanguticus]|uniref:Uncharacterized protein n=1 Tax=Anisodus tanguticus TaxID=243964 RepID=A0AAE1RK70_9SOLA|nr:hypothetical protein RND71_027940 [Anisodus tanguticus]
MSTASAYLVEVYAMKKIHKEKLKSLEKEEAKRPETCNQLRKSSSCSNGWFTKMFKKVHPVTTILSNSAINSTLKCNKYYPKC